MFTRQERDVPEYAEAMTTTPTTVTDEMYARLLGRLGAVRALTLAGTVKALALTPHR